MLETIYISLKSVSVDLAIISMIYITFLMIKKKSSIKVRIAFASIICALFIIQVILAVTLGKSSIRISEDVVCAILWAGLIRFNLGYLKETQNQVLHSEFKENEDDVIGAESTEMDIDER